MWFMQQHLTSLSQGLGSCSIRDLPDCYVLFHQDSAALKYRELRDVITSPNFSFGNFCYILHLDGEASYRCNELEFLVREPMLELTSYRDAADSLPVRRACRCGSVAYGFYVYSMLGEEEIDDIIMKSICRS